MDKKVLIERVFKFDSYEMCLFDILLYKKIKLFSLIGKGLFFYLKTDINHSSISNISYKKQVIAVV